MTGRHDHDVGIGGGTFVDTKILFPFIGSPPSVLHPDLLPSKDFGRKMMDVRWFHHNPINTIITFEDHQKIANRYYFRYHSRTALDHHHHHQAVVHHHCY
jgi:hypothetical protein